MSNLKVHVEFELSRLEMQSLVLLYQPVFSFNAVSLYLTFYEVGKENLPLTVEELTRLFKEPFDTIQQQRVELERFGLCHTYEKDGDFLLVLQPPLLPKPFLQHPMYGRLYSIVCGQESYKSLVLKYVTPDFKIEGKDITQRFDGSRLAVWNESLENEFSDEPKVVDKPGFDADRFFEGIPTIVYPQSYRTPMLKEMIREVGTLYQINYEMMKRLVLESTNFDTGDFNTKKFVFLVEKEFGSAKVDPSNPYDVDPISFLRHKQGYDYVVDSDRNLIKSLSVNFGFSNQVINFLIEYVLQINENNLTKAYVEKIAATWKRNNVETLEDAQKEILPKERIQRQATKGIKHVAPMPEYSKDTSITEDEDEIRQRIKEMLEKGGS